MKSSIQRILVLLVAITVYFFIFHKTKEKVVQNFDDSVKVHQIIVHMDSIGFWAHSEHDEDFWTKTPRVLSLNDTSFLEFSLIASLENFNIYYKHWGLFVNRVWENNSKCYITTLVDWDANGIPDGIAEEEITSFKHDPKKSLLEYYDPYAKNKTVQETIPPTKFEDLSLEKQKELQLLFSKILNEIKEKMQFAKKASWQKGQQED